MVECAVCWTDISSGSESTLMLSKEAIRLLKEELGYSGDSELSVCQDCIQDIIADYVI